MCTEVREAAGAPPCGVRSRRGQEVHPGGRQRRTAAERGLQGRNSIDILKGFKVEHNFGDKLNSREVQGF